MNLYIFALIKIGVAASWLIVFIMLALPLLLASPDVKGSWLKLGLRRTYYRLVDPVADDAFADQPNDLKQLRKAVDPLYDLFLMLNIIAGLAMLALTAAWVFEFDASAANFGRGLLGWSSVMITVDYVLTGVSVLLIGYWQSLNMIAGKRLKTMRQLVKVVSLINAQAVFADYHQPLRRALVMVADLPEQSFQSFWQQFNEHGELLGRLTVLQHVLQQDNLEQLLKENADLSTEVNKTIQTLLDTLTNGLYVIEDVLQQAAEQNREQQSNQLLNEFKAVTDLRKRVP